VIAHRACLKRAGCETKSKIFQISRAKIFVPPRLTRVRPGAPNGIGLARCHAVALVGWSCENSLTIFSDPRACTIFFLSGSQPVLGFRFSISRKLAQGSCVKGALENAVRENHARLLVLHGLIPASHPNTCNHRREHDCECGQRKHRFLI